MIAVFLALNILSADPKVVEEKTGKGESYTLEITGEPSFKFMGICVSSDGAHEKKIGGTVPAEIQLDTKFQKCTVKGEEPGKSLNVRLFQNRKLLLKRDDLPPLAGAEIVIPLSSSKKRK